MDIKITKDMGILDAIRQYPEREKYFSMVGMSCFGCMAAHFEDIEQGCLAHGIDPDVFVRNLNFFLSGDAPTETNIPEA